MLAVVFNGCEKESIHQEPIAPEDASAEGMIKLGKDLKTLLLLRIFKKPITTW